MKSLSNNLNIRQGQTLSPTLFIHGKINEEDFQLIKKSFETVGISVDRPINKANLLQEAIEFVFSDFNTISHVRDTMLGAVSSKVLEWVMNYFKDKKHIESQVTIDKTISYGRKSFTVCITCHYEDVIQIEKQVEFLITPFVMRKVPNGSRFFVTGQKDKSIKVTVLERGTGKHYTIN